MHVDIFTYSDAVVEGKLQLSIDARPSKEQSRQDTPHSRHSIVAAAHVTVTAAAWCASRNPMHITTRSSARMLDIRRIRISSVEVGKSDVDDRVKQQQGKVHKQWDGFGALVM